jgi:hypothetical protein
MQVTSCFPSGTKTSMPSPTLQSSSLAPCSLHRNFLRFDLGESFVGFRCAELANQNSSTFHEPFTR